MPKITAQQSSGGGGNAAGIFSHLECPRFCDATLAGGDVATAETEEVGDLVAGEKEMLGLPR